MARYKLFVVIVTLLSFSQIIQGQKETLISNPAGGQNVNQAITNKAGIKSTNENLLQNDNLPKSFNLNNVQQYNQQAQPSSTLQPSLQLQQIPNVQQSPSFSLSQNLTPLVNQKQNQLSEMQMPITYQPLNMPQSSYLQQPILKDTSRTFFPVIQQSSTLQPSLPLQQIQNVQQSPSFSLSQNLTPLVNQKQNQLSEIQTPITYQPLNMPQSSYLQQPILKDTSRTFFPVIEQSSVQSINPQLLIGSNYQQVPVGTTMQKIPVQVSQALPTSNSYLPYIVPVPNYGSQCAGFTPNLESNYARTFAASPISEAQIVKSFPVQYQTGSPTSNLSVLGRNVAPYQNQAFGIANSPLDMQNNVAVNNELFESDNLTSLLWSLLQNPKSTSYPQYYGRNSYVPYGTYNTNTGSKSTGLKSLLPLIFDIIKEKRQSCGCNECCRNNLNNNLKKQVEPQINSNYSRKRDYSLRDEMFRDNNSDEDIPRIAREHKKCKTKNSIPIESMESNETNENDQKDSDEFSDEQD